MHVTTMILCLALFLVLPAAAQEPCEDPCCKEEPSEPVVCKVYDGLLSIDTGGGVVHRRVVVGYWQIENDVTVKIPHQGLLIVELRAGSLIAEAPEERQEHHMGSFWSVPADQHLIVQTKRDSVVLQTVDLIPQ